MQQGAIRFTSRGVTLPERCSENVPQTTSRSTDTFLERCPRSVMQPFGRHEAKGQLRVATLLCLHTHSAVNQLPNLGRGQQPHWPWFVSFIKWHDTSTHIMDIVVTWTIGEDWLKCLIQCLIPCLAHSRCSINGSCSHD